MREAPHWLMPQSLAFQLTEEEFGEYLQLSLKCALHFAARFCDKTDYLPRSAFARSR